jgi:hypothetical protein
MFEGPTHCGTLKPLALKRAWIAVKMYALQVIHLMHTWAPTRGIKIATFMRCIYMYLFLIV